MKRKVGFWVPLLITSAVVVLAFVWIMAASYNLQLDGMRRLAGGMLSVYPSEGQAIVDAFSQGDAEAGAALLSQYGLSNGLPFWLNDFQSAFIRSQICICAGTLTLILTVWMVWYGIDRQRMAREERRLLATVDAILSGGLAESGAPNAVEARLYQIATKLRHGAEKLAQDKARLQSLVTDVSHQIKTPLASIQMFNGFLLEGDLTFEEQEEFLHRSQSEIEKLGWLTQSLVLVSRMETGMIALKAEPLDLRDTLREAIMGVSVKAKERNITLETDTPDDALTVAHDDRWTREAIFNILDNAVKYGREGGHIRVAAIDLVTAVRIDIIDNGPGVALDEVTHIFRRFFRGSASATTDAEGAGVGLYLARKIIEDQHGSVTVEETPGGGATFRVFLTKL